MKELTGEQIKAIDNLMHDFRCDYEGARDTDSIEVWVDKWIDNHKQSNATSDDKDCELCHQEKGCSDGATYMLICEKCRDKLE